jgi:hypothetical protein
MTRVAGFSADEPLAREHDRDLGRPPQGLDAYAHIEGLVDEESELQETAEENLRDEHRHRLHAIGQELDRAWEALRQRAERRPKSSN